VEKVLPVRCLAWDDRIETPEGCYAEVTESHALFNDIPGEWPWLLGYNEVEMHPEGKLLATVAGTGHPLLAFANISRVARWCGPAICRHTGCRKSLPMARLSPAVD
jgi:uncharacterized membrane protein